MKMILVLLFLWSGSFHLTIISQRLRVFSPPTIGGIYQSQALQECNNRSESLPTLYDEGDHEFIKNYTNEHTAKGEGFWLGLRKRDNITWLDGTPYTSNLTEHEGMCQAIDNRTWNVFNCSDRKPFMCYKGSTYNLIESKKTWCQALKHCRDRSSDLVSISKEKQNITVIEKGRNTSFWIGLMLDKWEWEDKGCSSYRKWANSNSAQQETHSCTSQSIVDLDVLTPVSCTARNSLFCSKGTVRIKVIKLPKTWEEAFNYCKEKHTRLLWIRDKSDQWAVAQWLNHTDVPGPFWIGLRQSRIFGFWLWSSDTTVIWENWKDGRSPELPLSNHCGVIKRDNYKWSDEDCQVPLSFLCEEEISFMKNNLQL